MQIIREFLSNEINVPNNDYVRFEALGPSPFHLDCYMKGQKSEDEENWLFSPEEYLLKGYNQLMINYNIDEFKDVDEAFEFIIESIKDEFGFYYYSVQNKVQQMHLWGDIQDNLNTLVQIQNFERI